jgi:catechol 2,3-dioxygenase-like lactoylglutathione lyase family enzyme
MLLELARPTLDVGLVVHDRAAMIRFYAQTLGLEPDDPLDVDGGEVLRFLVGASTVKLFCLDAPPAADDLGWMGALGYRLLTVVVTDLDAVVARAEADGVSVERKTFGEGEAAIPLAFLADPDGNSVELVGIAGIEPFVQIGLTVADAAASNRFYVDTLGCATSPATEFEGRVIHNVRFGATGLKYAEGSSRLPVRSGFFLQHAGIRYLTAHVVSLDDSLDRLRSSDVTIAMEPTEIDAGRVAFIADPDGNWIELLERR